MRLAKEEKEKLKKLNDEPNIEGNSEKKEINGKESISKLFRYSPTSHFVTKKTCQKALLSKKWAKMG